jgi:uncharacterized repeat protein (TIGR03843 family)
MTSGDEGERVPITVERLLEVLTQGQVGAEHGAMRWSSNYTFLLSVTLEDVTTLAVYKPQRGERPLWDFPDGTLCYRETAAFQVSHALGWQIVPPTVLREGPHGIGSVQFYIEHDPEQNYFSFDKTLHPQLRRIAVFDYLINNADRKGGHVLLDPTGHLWGIDHGIAFNRDHKLRTVIWDFAGEPIADDLLADVEHLLACLSDNDSALAQALCTLLSDGERAAFRRRIEKLLRSGHYPQPGPGPNFPWPPV